MLHKIALILCVAAVPFATAAVADSHSTDDETACRRDAVHFCRGMSEDYQVRDCLVSQKLKISHRCRTVLESHGL